MTIAPELAEAVSGDPTNVSPNPVSRHLQQQLDAQPLNRRHWLVFGVCSAGMLFDSLDLQLMSFAAPLIMKEWSMTPELLGTVLSAAVAGMIAGTYIFGTMADRTGIPAPVPTLWGRKRKPRRPKHAARCRVLRGSVRSASI